MSDLPPAISLQKKIQKERKRNNIFLKKFVELVYIIVRIVMVISVTLQYLKLCSCIIIQLRTVLYLFICRNKRLYTTCVPRFSFNSPFASRRIFYSLCVCVSLSYLLLSYLLLPAPSSPQNLSFIVIVTLVRCARNTSSLPKNPKS